MAAEQVVVRTATEADIPAIIALLLTSFRQFPIFTYLYSPLATNADAARDTVWVWRRRLLLELLDPAAAVLVAEVPETLEPTQASPGDADDAVDRDSWRMLEWVTRTGKLPQASKANAGWIVVGFAVWQDRIPASASPSARADVPKASWLSWLRVTLLHLETSFWSKIYQRRDVDLDRYRAYGEAEDVLEEQYYQERCYYLDNLCVDFRHQRQGIGTRLLEQGIQAARQRKLSIGTEASIKGIGLYRKMGFEQVGTWRVAHFDLPVMKLALA